MRANLIAKCIEAVRRFDKAAFNLEPEISLPDNFLAILREKKLVIADVGAAGEPDPRWEKLRPVIRFVTFEPRAESAPSDHSSANFSFCLGAKSERRTLYLTQFADSSSIYRLNMDRMRDFAVRDCFELTGTIEVEVRSLDEILANSSELLPSFLKLDVEGAELDVLTGAEAALVRSALGLRVEVSFLERHIGAPRFGEVDAFLRERGFELFLLSREQMIRHNLTHVPLSQPQLIWGDAIYFLTRDNFLKRLTELPPEDRVSVVIKFITILLSHRVHDYAIEIVQAVQRANLVSIGIATQLEQVVRQSAHRSVSYFLKAMAGTLFAALIYAVSWPAASARRMATFYLKRRAGCLFFFLWRLTARSGERNASVSDSLP